MRTEIRVLLVFLGTLLLTAACAAQGQRVNQTAAEPPPAVPAPGVLIPPPTGMRSLTEGIAPIPGHPPVTMSGVVKSVDPVLEMITFQDGRTVKLSRQSKVLQPVDIRTVRPGAQVVVRDALPAGVWSKSLGGSPDAASAAASGKRQRMATVASIDEPNQTVQLTDGTAVRVTPSTEMHLGTAGAALVLADLRPGDELVIVIADDASTPAGTDATAAPSALPRPPASTSPRMASEVMVFRESQTP